ncbi:substrate-binding periplasmic protein [Flexithrix dorotheae]|uniref:substrate-binding periplasmic protein n=1 Tax=Flexithrix dorotheae TaxID=70993 RepID=UPI00037E40C7|nr:transporter substrate-binding domain-containing protein [Flexithrix dorotheae]
MKLILLFCLILTSFSVFSQNYQVKLASDIWPPFTNIKGEKTFASDLVKEALRRSATGETTEILDFQDVLSKIKEGEYDGSAALWKSAEREEYMLFSVSYLQNQLILVGRKGNDVSAASLSELNGNKVAVVGNYAYGEEVENAKGVEFISGKNDQENLEKLLKGETDYMLVDALLIQYLLHYQREEAAQYLEIGTTPLITRSLHFALRKDLPNAEKIIEGFNEQIVKMVIDGSYNRILQINWIKTDVDGDGKLELVLNGNQAGQVAPSSSYNVFLNNEPSLTHSSTSNRYYVEGNIYHNWDNVPEQYKQPQVKIEDPGQVKLFKFNF